MVAKLGDASQHKRLLSKTLANTLSQNKRRTDFSLRIFGEFTHHCWNLSQSGCCIIWEFQAIFDFSNTTQCFALLGNASAATTVGTIVLISDFNTPGISGREWVVEFLCDPVAVPRRPHQSQQTWSAAGRGRTCHVTQPPLPSKCCSQSETSVEQHLPGVRRTATHTQHPV